MAVGLIAGILRSIIRARQSKGVDFVVSHPGRDVPIARAPIDRAVHDRWPIYYRTAARKIPEDLSRSCVKCVHLPGIRTCIHDAVRKAHRARVNGAYRGICGLPKNLAGGDIKSGPRSPM